MKKFYNLGAWFFHFICVLAVLWLLIVALCLFLTVPWVGLWFVIVAFPGQTYLFFGYTRTCTVHGSVMYAKLIARPTFKIKPNYNVIIRR